MKSANRPNILLCAAGVLFCLVLISVHLTSGLYARFTTRAQGADSGRAAAFYASASADEEGPLSVEILAGDASVGAFPLRVENLSDTTVRCDIVVQFERPEGETQPALPGEILLDETPLEQDQGKPERFRINDVATLAAGEQDEYLLSFDMAEALSQSSDWKDFSNDTISGESGACPFTVQVVFTQVN